MSDADRLLVRLPNWLGDLLLARSLLHALRRARPGARITAVAPAALLELLEDELTIDVRAPWPPDSRGRSTLVGRLREVRPGAALVLPPSFSSAWWAWRTGAPVRIGFRSEWRDPLLTHALRRPGRGEMHLSREYLELGRALGVEPGPDPAPEPPALAVPARAFEAARELLSSHGLARGSHVVLGPGATYGPAKRWEAGRFSALGRELAARGHAVLVCGARGERDTCEAVAREVGAAAVSLAGLTVLPIQAALCARAAVAVCNDSGLAHLSAAVGAPTVAIFGSTSSAWTAPLGPKVRVVQRAPVCSPCFQRTCRIGYRCLAAVEVEHVARACDEVAA